MIVFDASAALHGLLNDGDARRLLATEVVMVPHLIDTELTHALRDQVLRAAVPETDAARALDRWRTLGLGRVASVGLLGRVWALRENLTSYDATFVALAEALECALVTADRRLGGAPGPTCPITVVRS
ncbi:MAG: type II toxin-antitoxin system VapC family toxin [Acidimicrobiia bacterium]